MPDDKEKINEIFRLHEELERTVLGNIDWTREHLREGGRLDGNDISRGQGAGTSGD